MSRTLRPLAALALIALISAGCGSNAPSETGTASSSASRNKKLTARDKAVKFAECMRAHGVSDFPDPNAKGEFEYGVSVTPAVWKQATTACKDLQPPGTLSAKRTPKQQSASLRFAQCIRDNGVKDFPDPVNGEPAHQHVQDPILQPARWHDHSQRRDAEVRQRPGRGSRGPRVTRKSWALAAAAVLVAAICGVVVMSGAEHPTAAAQAPAANTVKVEQGELSAMVSQDGTLTYRARSDGSPYPVINQARGVYTSLPDSGDKVGCGGVLYRVDDSRWCCCAARSRPTARCTWAMQGRDVRQLNRNLHQLGYDADAHVRIDPGDNDFTAKTEQALRVLQRSKGVSVTGALRDR